MNFLITLLILILMLGIIVFIHELGHFISAKKSGVYIEEFALGMGPVIWKFKRKNDPTQYSLRLFPIGGFVAMANSEDEGYKITREQVLENKSFLKRFLVLIMGIVLNCILAIILLFINGLIYGSPSTEAYIGGIKENSPAYASGLEVGDMIIKVNDTKVYSWDEVLLEISVKELKDNYTFTVVKKDGKEATYDIVPVLEKDEEGNERRVFGVAAGVYKENGFVEALKYSMEGFVSMVRNLFVILKNIFTGGVGVNNLSGPVGIFNVIDTVKESGLEKLIYLTAYLSMNVAIINLLPIPVFDGGRILLLIVEAIKRKKLNPKVELYLNYFGFGLMILLMIFVTFNDIRNIFW